MEVANLPVKADQTSSPSAEDRLKEALADNVFDGKRPPEIAAAIYPDDKRKRMALRHKLWRMVRYDADFQRRVAERAAGEMVLAMGPAAQALGRSAGRGRIDAVKLLFEASGFHNPKVSHEHSGEIKVKLEIPRPKFEEPVDAEVVDDVSP